MSGFWDGYDSNTGKPLNAGPDYGKTVGQIQGEYINAHPIESTVIFITCLVVVITVLIIATKNIRKYTKRYRLSTTAVNNKRFYLESSKKPAWRLMNVVYWVLVLLVIFMVFMATDSSGRSLGGYNILVALMAYPGYLGLRRIVAYVFDSKRA